MAKYISPDKLKRFYTNLTGRILNTKEEIDANTNSNMYAGALAVKEINNSLKSIKSYSLDYSNAETFNMPQTNITMEKRGVLFPIAVYSSTTSGVYYAYANDKYVGIANIHYAHSRLGLNPIPVEIGDKVRSSWQNGSTKESDQWMFVPYTN